MRTLLNTLYVTTPDAYLHLEGETACVIVGEKQLKVPLHHLGSIMCFDNVRMSHPLLCRCASAGRTVIWMHRSGRFLARVEGPTSGNILLRQAQYRASEDQRSTLDIARAFVAGKLRNCRQVLVRAAREAELEEERARLRESARQIRKLLRALPSLIDLDQLRGHEGEGARCYYSSLNDMIRARSRECFRFSGRNRRPPRDRVNALLSFLYAVLLNDCRSALEGVGLDPQLGYLHAVRPGRMSLALDLMEELRPILADRVALTLINRAQLDERSFEVRPGGAVLLTDSGRKSVIAAYQERKQDKLEHPVLHQSIPLALVPHIQARLLARTLRGDIPGYVPFLYH